MRTVALSVAAMVSAAATDTSVELAGGSTVYDIDLFAALKERATRAADLLSRCVLPTRPAPGPLRVDFSPQPAPTANHFALATIWRSASDRNRQVSSATVRSFRAGYQDIAASAIDERLNTEITL